jgi:U5 small nuclear ribonucleoprotein component
MCVLTMHVLRLSPECSFLINMMSFPEMIRNVAVVGHLHHGKTALLDMLIFETHKIDWNADNQARICGV